MMMLILRKHLKRPIGALLIILQIAVTLAIVANAINMIHTRTEKIQRPSGLQETILLSFSYTRFGEARSLPSVLQKNNELYHRLKTLPDVGQISFSNSFPMHYSSNNSNLCLQEESALADCPLNTTIYSADHQFVETLGLNVVEGRNFTEEEVIDLREMVSQGVNVRERIQPMLITKHIADEYFPNDSALGKSIYIGGSHGEVVGVVEQLQRTYINQKDYYASVIKINTSASNFGYVAIRAPEASHAALSEAIKEKMMAWDSQQIISNMRSFAIWRNNAYKQDQAIQQVLFTVMGLLLFVSAVGVGSLVNFSVIKEKKAIGTKRALGATRGNILREMMLENAVLVSIGCLIGALLAYLINDQLLQYFSVTALNATWAWVGALLLLALGQCVSLWPALQATRISPAIATRTV